MNLYVEWAHTRNLIAKVFTEATGYLGRHLVAQLVERRQVRLGQAVSCESLAGKASPRRCRQRSGVRRFS